MIDIKFFTACKPHQNQVVCARDPDRHAGGRRDRDQGRYLGLDGFLYHLIAGTAGDDGKPLRSEEHTSELQSRGHLVCRLLLEKKKQTKNTREKITQSNQQKTTM